MSELGLELGVGLGLEQRRILMQKDRQPVLLVVVMILGVAAGSVHGLVDEVNLLEVEAR